MVNGIPITIKILPPFTPNSKSIEKTFYFEKNPSIIDLLTTASNNGILKLDSVVECNEIRDGVVVLVNGKTVFDVRHRLDKGDRVVVMPLVPGG
ncbi:MAG: MoaD/ThiS family protein [Ignisphaera sp.]